MTVSLHALSRSTGSAKVAQDGYVILCAVNGPHDPPQRRDELPNEASVDVSIRPHDGVPQVRERHLELLVTKVVKNVVLVEDMPRSSVQVAFQILGTPGNSSKSQSRSNLTILPALLQGSCFALLDAAIPMRSTFNTTAIAISKKGELDTNPDAAIVDEAKSLHVFTSDSDGRFILVQSEGEFDLRQWDDAEQLAQKVNRSKQESLRQEIEQDALVNRRWSGR